MTADVVIDAGDLHALADRLASLEADALDRVQVSVVNVVATRARDTALDLMNAGINLPSSYISERLRLEPAAAGSPTAVVAAPIKGVNLGRYSVVQRAQVTKRVKGRKGDAARGLPVGTKAGGLSVEVVHGARKAISYAFVLPGKVTKEGTPIVFERLAGGKVKSLAGLSVFQLFKHALDDKFVDGVGDDLEQTSAVETTAELARILGAT